MLWVESGDCSEIINEDGTMSINVNVNTDCGCSGGGGGDCTVTLLPYNPGGSTCLPIETSPISPPDVPPLLPDGDGVGIPDPIYPNDPTFPGTPEEYNAERCEMAEFAFSYLRRYLEDFKLVDNIFLSVSAIVLFLLSSGTAAVIALITRATAAQILAGAAMLLEITQVIALWDEWIDDAIAILEENKDAFMCGVYENLDTDAFIASWATDVVQATIADWQTRPDWQNTIGQPVLTFLTFVYASTPLAALARLNRVAAGFVPVFDCTVCEQEFPAVSGYIWVPARFGSNQGSANLTTTTSENHLTSVYAKLGSPGGTDILNYDFAQAVSDAGLSNVSCAGVLWQTIQSVAANDNWRLQNFYGPPDWSPRTPPDTQGAWGWARNSVYSDQPILDFGQWVSDNNGRNFTNTGGGNPVTVDVNANFDPPAGTTLLLDCWFLVKQD